MNILPVISSAIGIIGGINANREAEARARRAQALQDEIQRKQLDDYNRRLQTYYNLDAQGAFDPTAQIAQNEATVGREVRTGVGNLQANILGRGYNIGDTNMEQGSRAISERGRLALSQMNLNTRRQANNDRMNAMSFASPNSLSNTYQGAVQQENLANNSMVDVGGLIGQAASYFTPQKKKALTPEQAYAINSVGRGLGRISWR